MYKNRRHPAEAERCLFCCPILLDRCRFCSFLKLLSYRHTAKRLFFFCFLQRPYKPGSVVGSHLSWANIAVRLFATRLEIGRASRSPQVGVASDRVYRMPRSPGTPVGSYPTFPPFPRRGGGVVYFCCTCPAVARGRCYRLSCSVKPGLSSRSRPRAAARAAAVLLYRRREKMSTPPFEKAVSEPDF